MLYSLLFSPAASILVNLAYSSQALIVRFGASYSALLLTPLEDGIYSKDWRVRHSSVLLLGTLIDCLLRSTGAMTAVTTAPASLLIPAGSPVGGGLDVLSLEKRAFILSSLYIVRSDENPAVRQAATAAWKEVVQNTPKTLKEILPIMLKRLLGNLTAPTPERQK